MGGSIPLKQVLIYGGLLVTLSMGIRHGFGLFNLPITAAKNQPIYVDPVLKRKLKVYGKESAHTFVDQLFGGQLLSTL